MYTRPYFKDDDGVGVPEDYAGTALAEESTVEEAACETASANPWENPPRTEECKECEPTGGTGFLGGRLSDLFRKGGIKNLLSGIGSEEILIIAVALFLFLSRDGDKECAIMLLLLLVL